MTFGIAIVSALSSADGVSVGIKHRRLFFGHGICQSDVLSLHVSRSRFGNFDETEAYAVALDCAEECGNEFAHGIGNFLPLIGRYLSFKYLICTAVFYDLNSVLIVADLLVHGIDGYGHITSGVEERIPRSAVNKIISIP